MEKLDLFRSKKEMLLFTLFMLLLFAGHLLLRYHYFQQFHEHKFFHTGATVLNHYQKRKPSGKIYQVLKLRSDNGAVFYTTNYEDLINLKGRRVRLGIITDKITFTEYLRTFYVPSYDIRIFEKERGIKSWLHEKIVGQHESNTTAELFSALFLGEPIGKPLRRDVSKLGISHLIAISGFHLGVLFAILYFLFRYPYYQLQNRYFPYRNMRFDLTMVILAILFAYLWMLDFIPSLLRSFVMLAYGFFLFHRHFKILSFEVLFVTVVTILVIFPSFLFSIGFWFSVAGVFYIYLFLHHFSHLKAWQIVILLNIWVYLLMIPVVHYFFTTFSWYQLCSPLLSILFVIFYPLEMLLHLIGQGDLLDGMLLKLLHLRAQIYHFQTPLWYLVLYIFLSLVAVRYRLVAIALPLFAIGVYLI
ncbi:MAG: ComEC/Rec2 family competence protein [Sulfurospirillum sp.]|nr:MAG: ComEC/Rec2 family competence protein [Sulfurospirillum sp.]